MGRTRGGHQQNAKAGKDDFGLVFHWDYSCPGIFLLVNESLRVNSETGSGDLRRRSPSATRGGVKSAARVLTVVAGGVIGTAAAADVTRRIVGTTALADVTRRIVGTTALADVTRHIVGAA